MTPEITILYEWSSDGWWVAEIAEVVAFLVGPRSSVIQGAVIMAEGGTTAADLSMAALAGI